MMLDLGRYGLAIPDWPTVEWTPDMRPMVPYLEAGDDIGAWEALFTDTDRLAEHRAAHGNKTSRKRRTTPPPPAPPPSPTPPPPSAPTPTPSPAPTSTSQKAEPSPC